MQKTGEQDAVLALGRLIFKGGMRGSSFIKVAQSPHFVKRFSDERGGRETEPARVD
jgi:hypothetical protein